METRLGVVLDLCARSAWRGARVRRARPAPNAPRRITSAYVFGAASPGKGKAAAVIMPICNSIAMNHHLRVINRKSAPRPTVAA